MSFRPKTFTYSAVQVTAFPWIPLDWRVGYFDISFNVVYTGTGDVTYKVQGTLDDPFKSTTLNAFDIVSGKTAGGIGNYAHPITAIRLNTTAVSGAASLAFSLVQTDHD